MQRSLKISFSFLKFPIQIICQKTHIPRYSKVILNGQQVFYFLLREECREFEKHNGIQEMRCCQLCHIIGMHHNLNFTSRSKSIF